MSKKKKKVGAGKPPTPGPRPRRASKSAFIAALALCVVAASAASTWWTPLRRGLGLAPAAVEPARQQQGGLALSKEYVYAGGRLVATEEPQPAGPPPGELVASATASSAAGVDLSWAAPATGNVNRYVVERRQLIGGGLTTLAENVTLTSYHDATAAPDTAYLYYVRAFFDGGGASALSDPDLATNVAFTDTLAAGVPIKAQHLNELRRAAGAVRALAGLGPPAWTHPDPVSSPPEQRRVIYLEDVTELRSQLDEALALLGLQTPYPAEPLLAQGAAVKAAHFEQLRERVR